MPIDDSTLAAILRTGLLHNVFRIDEVIAWADAEIARREEPPLWLIDLSLSRNKPPLDTVALLAAPAADADPTAVCRGMYALVEQTPVATFLQCEALARQLYEITTSVRGYDWSDPLFRDAYTLDDEFVLFHDYATESSAAELIERVRAFFDLHADLTFGDRLAPVRYHPDRRPSTKG
jgi:hypothetical protein